ncbi:MAG: TetR/AcrR family transcriptional regulator [Alphaproteobacteria bacterium]|nr:TetR/AcrR family transcriptional regulator [Alphaproteobacteria bacterium]
MPLADSPRPHWLTPLTDPRNETILSAAFDVFEEKGLHGATMLEIATAAKVSKETLYARFDSKEGLFYALLAWGSHKVSVDLEVLTEEIDANPVAALENYASACLVKMMQAESIEVHRIVVSEARRMPEVARVFDEFTCQATAKLLDRVVYALHAKGLAQIADRAAFEDAFIGLLRGNLHHRVMLGILPQPTEAEVETCARRAMRLLLKAFAPEPRLAGFVD